MNTNLLSYIWEIAERRDTKLNKKLYKWLNEDNLNDIVVDKNIFWFELTTINTTMPNYIYEYIKKICNKKGLTYLYDIN